MPAIQPPFCLTPFANETEAIDIEELTIENRLDRVTIYGSLVLTKDALGLARAQQLKTLIEQVVAVLEGESNLPERISPMPAESVKNPFN
ncbi:MAG: hypothetical protein V4695_01115 [Pseudomonadota bacterium]